MNTQSTSNPNINWLFKGQVFTYPPFERPLDWAAPGIVLEIRKVCDAFTSQYRPGHTRRNIEMYGDCMLGDIVVLPRFKEKLVLDGAQRIAAVTLLLLYFYRKQMTLGIPDDFALITLLSHNKAGKRSVNLICRDGQAFLQDLFDGVALPSAQSGVAGDIAGQWSFIERQDLHWGLEGVATLFLTYLTNKVRIVEFQFGDITEFLDSFCQLNSPGKPLTDAEIAKAMQMATLASAASRKSGQ